MRKRTTLESASAPANKPAKAPENKPESPKPPRLLRQSEVLLRTGLKATQIYHAERRGLFPKSRKIIAGGRAKAWLESEIDRFIETGEVCS